MKRSSSTSKPRKSNSLKRSRLLRRKGARFEAFDHAHIPYAWAAYKRGSFDEIPDIDEDMDASGFSAWLVDWLLNSGLEVITMFAQTAQHGEIPVGLAFIQYQGKTAWPHAIWFPDASVRNKMEITAAFFIELKKNHEILITSERKNEPWFNHLCKYGLIRKVGKLHDWWGKKDHAMLYHSVGN